MMEPILKFWIHSWTFYTPSRERKSSSWATLATFNSFLKCFSLFSGLLRQKYNCFLASLNYSFSDILIFSKQSWLLISYKVSYLIYFYYFVFTINLPPTLQRLLHPSYKILAFYFNCYHWLLCQPCLISN